MERSSPRWAAPSSSFPDVKRGQERQCYLCVCIYFLLLSHLSSCWCWSNCHLLTPSKQSLYLPTWRKTRGWLSKNHLGLPHEFQWLRHPASWTEHLQGSQHLQHANCHYWAGPFLSCKPIQCNSVVIYICCVSSVSLENPDWHTLILDIHVIQMQPEFHYKDNTTFTHQWTLYKSKFCGVCFRTQPWCLSKMIHLKPWQQHMKIRAILTTLHQEFLPYLTLFKA